MLGAVGTGEGDGDIGCWLIIKNNGECGGPTSFCGEQIARAIGGAGLGNGEARAVVIGCFERGGGCFSAGVAACVGGGGGECGGDVAIVEAVVNAGDGDGLGCIPVAGCECQRRGAE